VEAFLGHESRREDVAMIYRIFKVFLGCCVLLIGLWLFNPGVPPDSAYTMAEENFKEYAKNTGALEQDFVSPPPLSENVGRTPSLEWRSKSHPNCVISVVVDRKTLEVWHAWMCDGLLVDEPPR